MSEVRRYVDERFEGLQAGELPLEGAEFESCTFAACDLTEASLKDAKLYDCRFERTELALVNFQGAALRGVAFESCRLTGVDFGRLGRDPLGIEATFALCDLSFCLFRKLDLTGFGFDESLLRNAEFVQCKLEGVSFAGSDLERCIFDACNLEGADLRGARNYVMSPFTNRLKGMRVSLPEALGLLGALEVVVE